MQIFMSIPDIFNNKNFIVMTLRHREILLSFVYLLKFSYKHTLDFIRKFEIAFDMQTHIYAKHFVTVIYSQFH